MYMQHHDHVQTTKHTSINLKTTVWAWLIGGFNPVEENISISQVGSFPQVGVEIKNIWNHHPNDICHCENQVNTITDIIDAILE